MNRWRLLIAAGLVVVVGGSVYLRLQSHTVSVTTAQREGRVGCASVRQSFDHGQSGVWLALTARVTRLLPDAYGKYQHQRFIVACSSGLTVEIVNDVSVGRRAPVSPGDQISVRGEYIWNPEGGLIHFTHHGGSGEGGWILLRGKIYAWINLRTKTWISPVAGGKHVGYGRPGMVA